LGGSFDAPSHIRPFDVEHDFPYVVQQACDEEFFRILDLQLAGQEMSGDCNA
jgi:hypothetical protein